MGGNQCCRRSIPGERLSARVLCPCHPQVPRNSSPDPAAPPLTLCLWHWLRNPSLMSRRFPIGVPFTSASQLVPDPEKGGLVTGSPQKLRHTVSSNRSCGSGFMSPLLSPPPWRGAELGGAVVSAQILHYPRARHPEREVPHRGRVSAGLSPGKKARWAGAPRKQGNSETQLTPFPQPRGCLLYFPTHPASPKPGRNG